MQQPPKDDDGDVIVLQPEAGFQIGKVAQMMSELMEELGVPLQLVTPNMVIEYEQGCTPKEIVDGYHHAMRGQISLVPPTSKPPKGSGGKRGRKKPKK